MRKSLIKNYVNMDIMFQIYVKMHYQHRYISWPELLRTWTKS